MKIALIVHQDTVFPELNLWWTGNEIHGTLDNIIGVITTFKLSELIHDYPQISVIFTSYEEIDLGHAKDLARSLPEDVVPIVVDVANVKGDYDCELSNIYGFDKKEIKDIKDYIEGRLDLKCKTRFYNGNPDDEDDSWAFIKAGRQVLTYTIPVEGDFHTYDASIGLYELERATQGLRWLISYFLSYDKT